MNWGSLLTFILNYFEKNPQIAEALLTALLNLLIGNPAVLNKAVNAAVAYAEKASQPQA